LGLYSTLSAACDTDLESISVSGFKEALKLVLIAARTMKRLVTKSKSGSFTNFWDPTIWTELHRRLVAQDRFMASAALIGMCRQIIQLVQTQQALPNTAVGESFESEGRRDEGTAGNKRRADANAGVDIRAKKLKGLSTTANQGQKGK
jgi:hypothetical protein